MSTGLLIATASAVTAPQVAAAPQGTGSTYLLLYPDGASSSTDAASTVSGAGGTLVANYGCGAEWSPHAAGVAVLLDSASGKTGGTLSAALHQVTNSLACPSDTSLYDPFPATDNGAKQTCQGGAGHNSWFGSGEVDALKAVT